MAVLYRNTVMIRADNAKWVAAHEGPRDFLAVKQKELQAKGFKTKITATHKPEHLK